ncbi:FERM domain-containing protein 4A isoform X3 [Strongylocentrotus purpuratus]|uniref:FERM domain-containing protein n=1 Tax=Strongylocentrotus purpuratus TaxID=7668 RepID=A0A7M7MZL7_STRPU|nr:FERM domain-containing protein 4A isoform X3 [Strongylocentrotus purpuratus]
MSEGRRTQVVLLDDRRVELLVQPKLLSGDLLDLVASYFNLKEKEYFGLAFQDETNHHNWLQLEKKVLDHDFPTKSGILTLYFRVQFFMESINQLRDSITIELFYLQAKESVFKGDIEADSETVFELGAYVLQATEGDYTSDQEAHKVLKKLPVLPQFTLREHPSLAYCEERILFYYKRLGGLSKGQCIVCYMQLVEGLPTYGVHYYEVKDKQGIPWWLGLSFKGVCQYDQVDRVTPRKIFQWRRLQNIYYRDRKFSIEVTDPRRVSVSRRTFGVSNATVHAWYGHPTLIRSMWTMAVNQHQFYLDRKHNKDRYASMQRSFTQIANDITKSTNSLTSSQTSEVSSDPGQPQTPAGKMDDESSEINDVKEKEREKENTSRELLALEGEAAKKDIVVALKARKSVLQDRLQEKLEALKKICINEAELTGELPLEYPRKPGEQLPKIQRRVATAFTLSARVVNSGDRSCSQETQNLNQLESEMEIQSKITIAARRLADDPTISKKNRKTRRESYKRSAKKLDSIEKKLVDMKQNLGLLPQDQTPAEDKVVQSHTLPRKRSVPSTPPLLRPFKIGDRGRSKKKEDKNSRLRSKSVPRQLFENAWRSPSLGRRKDKIPVRPVTPVDIYNDNENEPVAVAKPEPQWRERLHQSHHQQHAQSHQQSRTPVCYETSLQSMATLDINHHSDSGSFRDDSSTYSDGSTRSQPEGFMTHPRTSVDHGNRLAQNRQSNFSSSMGDVTAVAPTKSNHISRTSPRRGKPPIQRRIDRGPPPAYNTPGKIRSFSQSGRYYESPEDTLGRADIDAPKLRQHASSMHDLQYALQGNNLPALSDDDLEYHQQPTSLSQPPSPKKHASLGNLAMKSNSLPGSDYEDQQLVNNGSHRGQKYRSHQYQKYSGQSQDSQIRPRDASGNYYTQKNSSNRMRNGSGDNHQAYNKNYASLDRLGKSRLDRDHRPSVDTTDSMYYSLDRRGHHYIEDTQISNDSSYASLDRPMHKPPLPSNSIDDVSMTSASRRRHNSFSSQRSTSSYSSQGSSNLSNHQVQQHPRTPLHQTSSSSSRQSEFSVYTSLASLSPSNSFSSNGAGSSHNSTFSEPQAASMYTTSTPVHLQPKVQQSYGTNIAISKAHYTPAQPMSCEPVSRSNRPSQTSSSLSEDTDSSLHSFTSTLEDSPAPSLWMHDDSSQYPTDRNLPRSYTPCIEDGSYQGDAGESLADGFSDEMLSWLDDHDGAQKAGTLV